MFMSMFQHMYFFGETHGCLCLCFSTCIFRRDSCMFLSIFQHMYF